MYKCVRGSMGGRGRTSWKVRGRFGEGSSRHRAGTEPAARYTAGDPAPDPPVGILYGSLIIPLLQPSSELAIMELSQQSTLIADVLDPYMGPMWILYGSL